MNAAAPTIVVRRIAAVPVRRAGEAWRVITDMIAEPGSPAHAELLAIASPAGLLIAQEVTRTRPIVITSNQGPRLRVYTTHGSDAADRADETLLAAQPCMSNTWRLHLPCDEADLPDVLELLANAPHVTAGEVPVEEAAAPPPSSPDGTSNTFRINRSQME